MDDNQVLLKKMLAIDNLSEELFCGVYGLLQKINDSIQQSSSNQVTIGYVDEIEMIEGGIDTDIWPTYLADFKRYLKYLHSTGVLISYEVQDNSCTAQVDLELSRYLEVLDQCQRRIENETVSKKTSHHINTRYWPEDFYWEGDTFHMGKYGEVYFKSSYRRHIVKILVEKKGKWATISELAGERKDHSYVRPTIGQIEERFPRESRGIVKIASTEDDDTATDINVGAYRIDVVAKP